MAALCVLGTASGASAQGGWDVAVYPVLGWLPLGIDINVDVPPFDGGGGGGGTGGDFDIIDGRFDGAFLGGFTAQKDRFRIEGDFVWAAVGGDRLENPIFSVDADVIYAHGNVGFGLTPELFITGGVRRFAVKYVIDFANQGTFERKPGLWDPLVGIGWHKLSEKLDLHAAVEYGGFGVGADVDLGAGFRFDWKPISHFGLTGGYNFLYFKASNTLVNREFTFKQTLHGPTLGIGFYF